MDENNTGSEDIQESVVLENIEKNEFELETVQNNVSVKEGEQDRTEHAQIDTEIVNENQAEIGQQNESADDAPGEQEDYEDVDETEKTNINKLDDNAPIDVQENNENEEEGGDYEDEFEFHHDECPAQEVTDNQAVASGKRERIYERKLAKSICSAGNTTITVAHAKLFGLPVDNEGKLKFKAIGVPSINEITKTSQKVKELSKPKALTEVSSVDDYKDSNDGSFKPTKTKEAHIAMSKCGYDFLDQLDQRGDFLERAYSKSENSKSKKSQRERESDDYEARLDKLVCPKCKKEQSFDEYVERRRFCSQCKERFVKGNIANRSVWIKRQKENEIKKQMKLKSTEEEMYSDHKFSPNLVTSDITLKIKDANKLLSITEKTNLQLQEQREKAAQELALKKAKEEEMKLKRERHAELRLKAMDKNTPIVFEDKATVSASYKAANKKDVHKEIDVHKLEEEVLMLSADAGDRSMPANASGGGRSSAVRPNSSRYGKEPRNAESKAESKPARPSSAGIKRPKSANANRGKPDAVFLKFKELVNF